MLKETFKLKLLFWDFWREGGKLYFIYCLFLQEHQGKQISGTIHTHDKEI